MIGESISRDDAEEDQRTSLIDSPALAAVTVCASLWMVIAKVRTIFTHRTPQWHGFHQFDGILPHYLGVAFELMPYIIGAWLLVTALRRLNGAERAWFVLLSCNGFLRLLRLLPAEAAQVVLYAQMGLELAMVVAAVQLFSEVRNRRRSNPPQGPS